MKQKRLVAINDISCFGRCSLTVASPIISVAGIETTLLPTALLSTHLDCFPGYVSYDLSKEMIAIKDHWKSFDLEFDSIYTGYLGSEEQVAITCAFIDEFKTDNCIVVIDPVLGDSGTFYELFDHNYAQVMKGLVTKADIITPNLTEACLLLDIPYSETFSREEIEKIVKDLSKFGPNQIVLTSVSFEKDKIGVLAYDKINDEIYYTSNEKINVPYAGTGDIFTSTLCASLLSNHNLKDSIEIASKYVFDTIVVTNKMNRDYRYGLNFEYHLSSLGTLLNK
ncbi:MAG: pyridoxamine kinase [Erysipelotrichales bacterium]